ncbi:SH3 domain-containing protein 19-like isoform X2 [Dysidea avara]|uniref:SH3 domain-containing protein 19-like isoform X2 n=1 Tax=Dysidea avara TaxID=196820 RepID=UPI0033253407
MATPRIPPRPVSYVSSTDTMEKDNDINEMAATNDSEVQRPEKPPPASEPTLPAKDSAPPKPLRKAQSQQSASTQQSVSVPVKPPRPRSTHEPDRSAPPRPTRPPTVKPATMKPPVAKAHSKPPVSEQTPSRPVITVISAKPMDSSGSIPLPDISDMKADEKPKPTKPSRPPLIKHDNDKVHTEKDAELTKSSSLERPVAKKRTSHDAIPDQTGPSDKPVRPPSIKGRPAIKSRSKSEQHEEDDLQHSHEEQDSEPVPRKRTKSNAKLAPAKPALPQDKKKPPLRPAYSVDPSKLKRSSEEPSSQGHPEDKGSDDQQSRKPPESLQRAPVSVEKVPVVDATEDKTSDVEDKEHLKPTRRPRTHSGTKPPPKPKLPSSRPAPPKTHKPVASTTDEQEDNATQEAPQSTKQHSEDMSTVKDETSSVKTENKEHVSRAHSGVKPPPKPKPPASRPAPPKAHKPIASTTEKQEDEPASSQESSPPKAPQSTKQQSEDTDKDETSDIKPEDKEHVSRVHSGTKPPPKPKLPTSRPAPPKTRKPRTDKQEDEPANSQESSPSEAPQSTSEDTVTDKTPDVKPEEKEHVSQTSAEHKPPPKPSLPKPPPKPAKPAHPKPVLPKPPKPSSNRVTDDKQPKNTSDSQSEQANDQTKDADKAENEAVPAVSQRTSSKKWKPPVARPTGPKKDIQPAEKPEEVVAPENMQAEEDDDQPPPRPLPPQEYLIDNTVKYEEEIPSSHSVPAQSQKSTIIHKQSDEMTPSSLQEKNPSPLLEKKTSPTLEKKLSPMLEKKPSPMLDKKPSPTLDKKPFPALGKKPLPVQENKSSPTLEKRPSPAQEKKLSPSQLKKSLPQTEETEHIQPEENEPVSSKQDVDDLPKKSTKKLPPPKPAAPSKRLSQNMEDDMHPKPSSTEVDKKSKPPRPTIPSAPHKRRTPEPRSVSSTSVDAPPPLPSRPVPGHPLYRYVSNEPRGTAKFDYQPDDEDEISFLAGDLIEFIERVDDDWLYGRNTNDDCNEGLVLLKYVKVIKRLPGEDKLNYLKELPSAIAMFDFDGENEDELSFVAGDLIILEEKIDDMWMKGYVKSPQQSGIFPAKFVEVVEPLPPSDKSTSANTDQDAYAPLSKDSDQDITTLTAKKSVRSTPSNEPYCIVESEFISEGPGELSIEPGDRVILIERVNEDWLRGKLNEQIGMFPAAFVDIKVDIQSTPSVDDSTPSVDDSTPSHLDDSQNVPETTSSQPDTKKDDGKPKGKCRATFAFNAEQEGELGLSVGDIIITSSWVNDDWLYGECNGQEGMFPLQFVKILQELPKDLTTVSDKIPKNISAESDLSPRAKAIQDYVASDSDELSFKVGDVIYLLDKVDKQFFEGELNNKVGRCPYSHVEIIVPLP